MEENNIDKLLLKYEKALNILKDKFTKLYIDNLELGEENPIDHIKYRIKSKNSIKKKLENKVNLNYNIQNIEECLHDIAGIRIICPFLKDIEQVINYVKNDQDIIIIDIKNYIENPKENGYSSYHLKVLVPINNHGIKEYVKAEIQIRTMAMDLWANIEHILCYKKEVEKSQIEEMKRIAKILQSIDPEMDRLAKITTINKTKRKVKVKEENNK